MLKEAEFFENIIDRIEKHQAEMKKVSAEERKSGDLFISGYNRGIQDGLEAAINIIRKIEAAHYRKITEALLKKAKKQGGQNADN